MKSWFGRKAAAAARPLLHRAYAGAAGVGDWPRNYEAQVREAYLGNPVAQRAVRLVAESVAWAPVYATDGAAGAAASARALRLVDSGPARDGGGAAAAPRQRLRPDAARCRRGCRRSCSRCGPSG